MLTPNVIQAAINRANELSYEFASKAILDNYNGDQDNCIQLKIYVLAKWACILADYKRQNYDENDNVITPEWVCLSSDQVNKLIGKINSVKC